MWQFLPSKGKFKLQYHQKERKEGREEERKKKKGQSQMNRMSLKVLRASDRNPGIG
jgi:hypothetical protein